MSQCIYTKCFKIVSIRSPISKVVSKSYPNPVADESRCVFSLILGLQAGQGAKITLKLPGVCFLFSAFAAGQGRREKRRVKESRTSISESKQS